MFALGVEFLMGRAVMTRWDSRAEPEWPPHPDRVFMALVAAHGETGEDAPEAVALRWLQNLPPPHLAVTAAAYPRESVTSFVPVNDTADPILKGKPVTPMGSLAFGRIRQPRQYPATIPDVPKFFLVWPDTDLPDSIRAALAALCRKVTYLGHSASPVLVWIDEQPVEARLQPVGQDESAECRLRVFGAGRLEALKAAYDAGRRPQPSLWQGYSKRRLERPQADHRGPFDEGLIVLRQVGGRKFALESCGILAVALRDTLMRRYGVGAPEWLSGHQPDGAQSRQNRPAILPLAFVGREHADGHLLGVAIAVPDDFPKQKLQNLFDLLATYKSEGDVDVETGASFVRLFVKHPEFGVVGECQLELDERGEASPLRNLRPSTWTQPAKLWATTTPIVLPKFPRRDLKPEAVVAEACRQSGYPEPAAVRVSFAGVLPGVPHARSFHSRPSDNRPPRLMTHAVIDFGQTVRGPVVIGAGRYNGYGFCRPLPEDESP